MTSLNDTSLSCFAQGTEGDLAQCALDGVMGAGPAPGLIGLVMGGVLMTSLYIAGDGSVVVPGVVTILLGTTLAQILPPQFSLLAYSLAVIGGGVAVFSVIVRFTLRGRF